MKNFGKLLVAFTLVASCGDSSDDEESLQISSSQMAGYWTQSGLFHFLYSEVMDLFPLSNYDVFHFTDTQFSVQSLNPELSCATDRDYKIENGNQIVVAESQECSALRITVKSMETGLMELVLGEDSIPFSTAEDDIIKLVVNNQAESLEDASDHFKAFFSPSSSSQEFRAYIDDLRIELNGLKIGIPESFPWSFNDSRNYSTQGLSCSLSKAGEIESGSEYIETVKVNAVAAAENYWEGMLPNFDYLAKLGLSEEELARITEEGVLGDYATLANRFNYIELESANFVLSCLPAFDRDWVSISQISELLMQAGITLYSDL